MTPLTRSPVQSPVQRIPYLPVILLFNIVIFMAHNET
jgi:hypothetical protein